MSARTLIEAKLPHGSAYPGYPALETLGLSRDQIQRLRVVRERKVDEQRNPEHEGNAMAPKWIITKLVDAELDRQPVRFMSREQEG